MKNYPRVKVLAIILIVVGAFVLLGSGDNNPAPIIVDNSVEGCYVAKLSKDVYALKIESEKEDVFTGMLSYNNFEKDSSSGSLTGMYKEGILLGNYSFDSEGTHSNRQVIFKKEGENFIQGFGSVKVVGDKEEFTDISKIGYDSKSTFVKSPNCTEHFTDSNSTISFDYNSFFVGRVGDTPTLDWRLDGKQIGSLLAKVTVPRGYMPNTNFVEAHLTVGRSADQNAIKSCTVGITGSSLKADMTIDGYKFKKFESSDAGAGNFYETTTYAGIFDGDCYIIEYTIHSTNIGNYSPDQGIKEFDKSKIVNEMEKIVESFKFLISSD